MPRLLLCQACICSRKSDLFGEADELRAWTCQHRPWSEGNYLCYSWAASLNNNCLFEIIYYMNLYYHFILAYFTILSTSFSIIIIPSCFHWPTMLSSIIEWIMFICHSCNWSPKVSTKYLNSSIWSLPSWSMSNFLSDSSNLKGYRVPVIRFTRDSLRAETWKLPKEWGSNIVNKSAHSGSVMYKFMALNKFLSSLEGMTLPGFFLV